MQPRQPLPASGQPTFKFLRANPDVQVQRGSTGSPNFFIHTLLENWPWQGGALAFHLARLWSVFLSTCTVAATYGLVRTAFPHRRSLALITSGMLAFLPEFVFIRSAVNNDNAAALLGTLALWGGFAIYRAAGQFKAGWWTPFALGLRVADQGEHVGAVGSRRRRDPYSARSCQKSATTGSSKPKIGDSSLERLGVPSDNLATLAHNGLPSFCTRFAHRGALAGPQLAALWRSFRHGAGAPDN